MPSSEISILIDRPREEVFAYAVDIDKLREWNLVILDSWLTSGNNSEPGASYIVKARVMGRIIEIPSEVVEFEANRVYAYRSGGFMPYLSIKQFDDVDSGTRVSERIVMEGDGMFARLTGPIMLAISKRSHVGNLKELKRVLETEL